MSTKNPVSKNPADYPNSGLFHTPEHLRSVINRIAFFPIEKQAEYADAICRAMIDNHERQMEDLSSVSNKAMDKFNAVAIGNMAYIATNSSSVAEVRNALKILQQFKNYMTVKLQK